MEVRCSTCSAQSSKSADGTTTTTTGCLYYRTGGGHLQACLASHSTTTNLGHPTSKLAMPLIADPAPCLGHCGSWSRPCLDLHGGHVHDDKHRMHQAQQRTLSFAGVSDTYIAFNPTRCETRSRALHGRAPSPTRRQHAEGMNDGNTHANTPRCGRQPWARARAALGLALWQMLLLTGNTGGRRVLLAAAKKGPPGRTL